MRLKLRQDTPPVALAQHFTCCVRPAFFLFFPFFDVTHNIIPSHCCDDATLQAFRNVAAVNLIFESSLICNAQQKHNEKAIEQNLVTTVELA